MKLLQNPCFIVRGGSSCVYLTGCEVRYDIRRGTSSDDGWIDKYRIAAPIQLLALQNEVRQRNESINSVIRISAAVRRLAMEAQRKISCPSSAGGNRAVTERWFKSKCHLMSARGVFEKWGGKRRSELFIGVDQDGPPEAFFANREFKCSQTTEQDC